MSTNKYGTRAWMESQYASSASDPWGLEWRPSQQYRYLKMLESLGHSLDPIPQRLAIIDVGCATGYFTSMLADLQKHAEDVTVIGVDMAHAAVERAAARYPQIKFECMDLAECAAQFSGTADVVTCMEVLYYLPQAQRAQAVFFLKSLLKPQGLLLVSSMVAAAPYFSEEELSATLSAQLRIVSTGVLHLKPLVMVEKLLMKLGGDYLQRWIKPLWAMVGGMELLLSRIFPRLARSHAFVVARND